MTVQKDFKRIGLQARLSKVGGKKPVLSGNTRWTSQRNAAESFLENLTAMKRVAIPCDEEAEQDPKALKPDLTVISLLHNSSFVAPVNKLLDLLNPVAELTNICQSSSTSVANAAEKWLQLFDDGPEELREFLKYRCKQSKVFDMVAITANYFHPVYRGKRLNNDQQKQVKTEKLHT